MIITPSPRHGSNDGWARSVAILTTRTVAIYAFAAWVYVALVALILPDTLPLQLTHLWKHPRTDTFGEVSFVVSLLSYFSYGLLTTTAPGGGDHQ